MSINETALQRLIDEHEIVRCITRYARGIDRHDVDIIQSAFHSDSVDHHGGDPRGRQELAEWGNELHSAHTRRHSHFLANSTVDIDDDVAHAETYVLFVLWRRDSPVVDISGGRYIDRLAKRDGDWRIVERVVVVDWTAEAPEGKDVKGTLAGYAAGTWDRDDISYRRPLSWSPADGARHRFGDLLSPRE
jgi:hypothetical protein